MTKEEFSLLFHRAKVNLVAFKMLYEPEAFEAMQRMVEMAVAEERKVLKLALEALEKIAAYRPLTFAECSDAEAVIGIAENAIPVLRKALAQPEQEPVAYSGNGTAGREADVKPTGFFFQMPSQRTWVGLKDEEIDEIHGSPMRLEHSGLMGFVRAIEAKLRDKNGG